MKADFPERIDLQLTYFCNLHCKMCGQWGRNGIFRKIASELKKKEIAASKWLPVIDAAAAHGSEICLWGGEPLMSESFPAILGKIRESGVSASIVTNGTLLEKFAASIAGSNIKTIYLSLDGDSETHDRVRGMPGAFSKLRKGVEKIIKLRGASEYPSVEILSVVQKDNQDKLERIMQTASELGADRIQFAPLMFIDQNIHEKQRTVMREALDCDWQCSSGWDLPDSKADPDVVDPFLRKLPCRFDNIEAITTLPANASLREWQEKPELTFGPRKCIVPWKKLNIMPDGNCNFCMDFPDYSIGNINERSIESIWYGDRAERFRSAMETLGIFPACSRCIWLYNDCFERKHDQNIF